MEEQRPNGEDWKYLPMEQDRRAPLEEATFDEIMTRIAREVTLRGMPELESAEDRAAPPETMRGIFAIAMPPRLGDLLHNAGWVARPLLALPQARRVGNAPHGRAAS
jgi:hypothetical protein